MSRWIAVALAVAMSAISAFALIRDRKAREADAQYAVYAAASTEPGGLPCRALISTEPDVDIERAQERLQKLQALSRPEYRRNVQAFDAMLGCALAKTPVDGGILALMAWTAWRLDAPIEKISRLLQESYRVHPFEANTIAVRQLVIAANWDRLGADMQAIGRADQALRFATGRPIIVLPQVARLYREAGTRSDLYHEALGHIARTSPDLLENFEMIVETGKIPRGW